MPHASKAVSKASEALEILQVVREVEEATFVIAARPLRVQGSGVQSLGGFKVQGANLLWSRGRRQLKGQGFIPSPQPHGLRRGGLRFRKFTVKGRGV